MLKHQEYCHNWTLACRTNYNIMTYNKSFKRVEQLRYLGTSLINNFHFEEIKSILKSGNATYYLLQNLFFFFLYFNLLLKNIQIKIYRNILLPVVMYGCETWSFTLKQKCRLRVLRIFGHKRDKVRGEWRKLHNEELNDLSSSPNIVLVIKSRRIRWAGCVACMGEKRGVYTGFRWENLRERDLGIDGRIIWRWIFRKWDMGVWIGSSWLRIGTSDRNLCMQKWTFLFHKIWIIFWLTENLLVSHGLCPMELVT